jgi:hypothetical protein
MNCSVLLVLLLICAQSVAQQQDSLRNLLKKADLPDSARVNVLDELCYSYTVVNQDTAISFGTEAVALARTRLRFSSRKPILERHIKDCIF